MTTTVGQAPLDVLKSVYGYEQFRPGQREVVERVIGGGNAFIVMPTGGGKSLCYQLPAMVRQGVGVVVSPLIALMQDQVAAMRQLGVKAAFLNSTLGVAEKRQVQREARAGALDLLYVAPERLMMPDFLDLMESIDVALLAIDEVHCMSQWGHEFRPDYLRVAEVRRRFPHLPCLAATATADGPTRQDILKQLQLDGPDLFVSGFDRPNIQYTVVQKRRGQDQLLQFLREEHPGEAGIVYRHTRKNVEKTAAWLEARGVRAMPYHAGLSNREREQTQTRFLQEDGLVVVATVAFGMGIDKPDVRFVAHLDVPRNLEAYYQETGRAGRDGLPANAWMAYRLADVVRLRKMMERNDADEQHQRVQHHKLNAMLGYCETASCRRQVLLTYFGDEQTQPCGNCDTCLNPVETYDGTVEAQKVMSAVYRTGQRFGAGHVIDVLTGADTKKIRRFGHERLPTYGVGDSRTKSDWSAIVRQLIAAEYLHVDVGGYGSLQLTAACGPVLKGEATVQLRHDPTPATTSRSSSRRTKTAPELPETPEAEVLFDALRDLRSQLARDQGVPPYVIFHDATLTEMAARLPTTSGELRGITGIGEVKLERYGDAFLELLREHAG